MNIIKNPKILALVQSLFYGFVTIATPMFIASLGQGGAFYGMFSPTITVALLWILNLVDNQMSNKGSGNFFGAIQ